MTKALRMSAWQFGGIQSEDNSVVFGRSEWLMGAMAKKAISKPRSPVAGKVFEAFISKLRAEPQIDDAQCDRLEAALVSGQTINAASLKEALFPERGGSTSDPYRDDHD